jgi:23S rRNA pseudouridine1911/1915/1917 synthase
MSRRFPSKLLGKVDKRVVNFEKLVIHESSKLLVVNKPSGYTVQGGPSWDEDKSLLRLGKDYIKWKYQKTGDAFLAPVHRLDRGTSGVLMFCRNSKSASRASAAFREGKVSKSYLCLVTGVPSSSSGTLDDYFEYPAGRPIISNNPDSKTRKRCILSYSLLSSTVVKDIGTVSLLSISLQTGRKHQIRAQLSSANLSILGDVLYGGVEMKAVLGESSIALHSGSLVLPASTVSPDSNAQNMVCLTLICRVAFQLFYALT